MLSISEPLRAGAADCCVEYYKKHAKAPGVWFGLGAESLGLGDSVEDEQFQSLLLGLHPQSQEPLVQNAGRKDRQGAWDLTFSAPKSVSVLWSLLPKDERDFIEKAHTEAVKKILKTVEEVAGVTRRGKGGKEEEPAQLVFALFNDYTSRALEPQIHTHVLLFNVGVRQDGTTGTIVSQHFFDLKMALGSLYRVNLAENLSQHPCLQLERDTIGFRVKGVPEELCDVQSTRRVEIEAELARMGKSDAVSAKKAALKTRRTTKEAHMDVLFAVWKRVGESHSFGEKEALALFNRRREQTQSSENNSVFPELSEFEKEARLSAKKFSDIIQKAEKLAFAKWNGGKDASAFARFVAGHFVHVRTYKFSLPVDPLRTKGAFWKRKKVLIPYLALGPRQQRWGFVRKRLLVTRFGEFRIQERILFPRAPFVERFVDWRLPALRWVSQSTLEQDREWAIRRGLVKEADKEKPRKDSADKPTLRWDSEGREQEDTTREKERLKRQEEERRNTERASQSR